MAARSADRLNELAVTLSAQGAEAVALPGDVTSEEDRQRLLRGMTDRFGGLDVLVNNAGVASFGHFNGSNESVLRQVMEVNFFAPTELLRSALPLLQQGQQPAVLTIASMCGAAPGSMSVTSSANGENVLRTQLTTCRHSASLTSHRGSAREVPSKLERLLRASSCPGVYVPPLRLR